MAQSTYRLAITPYKDVLPRRRLHRPLALISLFVAFVVLFLAYIGVIGGNVRAVVPNKVYRSAQLTGATLGKTLDAHHIRTVINLRGGSPNDDYYRSELQECDTRGIAHVDIPLSARVLPPPDRLRTLLDTFDHAQYPVLFHCRGGSDRSGLTGVLYLNLYENVPYQEALHRQLTWKYGHFSFGQAHAMNDFYALYERTGQKNGLGLREWILSDYPALYARQTGDKSAVAALSGKAARPSAARKSVSSRPKKPAAPVGVGIGF